ncbi:MAG TPA: nickel-type superoxide dismutase maturation protease [Acidimicrobiales bacterium]|nr:nickel-type superoxide dismutase maturation protease [Acidimicrobiales bacterium]
MMRMVGSFSVPFVPGLSRTVSARCNSGVVQVEVTLPMDRRRSTRRAGAWAVVGVLVAAAALLALRRLEVRGDSMAPALRAGDRLVVLRLPRRWPLRAGCLVVLADPRPGAGGRLLVKRVRAVAGDRLEVLGDNPAASTDSRTFGPVPRASIVGVALYCYAPPERSGLLTGVPSVDAGRAGGPPLRPRRVHP